MTIRVAFIGLGNMGAPMAANLVRGGLTAVVFDLSPRALQSAAEQGCEVAASAAAAVADADCVVTMLPNGAIVEKLLLGESGLLQVMPTQALVMDCSTVSPQTSRRLGDAASQRGVRFIDAPVSGGVAAATAGTLAFMCGGAAADVEAARPVLLKMGNHVFHAGGPGAGAVAKICNNMLLAVHMIGTAEALQMGVDNGLDPKVLSEIMRNSSGCNWSLEKYNPWPGVMEGVPASRGYQGGFLVDLMLKDLGLARETAQASGSATPMGGLAGDLYRLYRRAAEGNGALDFSSIQQLFGTGH